MDDILRMIYDNYKTMFNSQMAYVEEADEFGGIQGKLITNTGDRVTEQSYKDCIRISNKEQEMYLLVDDGLFDYMFNYFLDIKSNTVVNKTPIYTDVDILTEKKIIKGKCTISACAISYPNMSLRVGNTRYIGKFKPDEYRIESIISYTN